MAKRLKSQQLMPSGVMVGLEPFWIYILVPVALVSVLLLIKLGQARNAGKISESADVPDKEGAQIQGPKAPKAQSGKLDNREKTRQGSSTKSMEHEIPQNCSNFLGYLFLKKAPERSHIPNECYNCSKLLQCLYSPNVIDEVYGQE